MSHVPGILRHLMICVVSVLIGTACTSSPPEPASEPASGGSTTDAEHAAGADPYRPRFHFSPRENWLNDPNGLVWQNGEYHLFFQYNPEGDDWGNMSWGHAVSEDLIHWEELGVAIPYTETEHVFSGGIVVDHENTSGFGEPGDPAMVAVYTSAHPETEVKAQSLAYSTDDGRTWTRYSGNPVLDLDSDQFRDPKVFWYEEGGYWVMAVVLAEDRVVQFYRSDDLREWEHLSDFGPVHATEGIWEMPDLFELPVDGDPDDTRWVLVVSVNPGSVAGGSGAQYFVGHFDGQAFHSERTVSEDDVPAGDLFADFEHADHGDWEVANDPDEGSGPFGTGPHAGTHEGQHEVTGHLGDRLVNGFVGGDGPVGRLTSPTFTIERDFINFLVGGGRAQAGTGGEPSPAVNLLIDDEVVHTASGQDSEHLDWVSWDVRELRGRQARIQIDDQSREPWGHILVDQIMFGDEPAVPRVEQYDWLDYGSDHYAAVSYNDVPSDRRILVAWMDNWQYAGDMPSTGWRGMMTIPREYRLETIDGRIRLTQRPAGQLDALRTREPFALRDEPLAEGVTTLPEPAHGSAVEIHAQFELGDADVVGVHVRAGDDGRTVIGYDAVTEELFVDRTESGLTAFHDEFPAVHGGPVTVEDGTVRFTAYVDQSSVEVFGDRGQTVISDRIFPDPGSDAVALFADGGAARVTELTVQPLEPQAR